MEMLRGVFTQFTICCVDSTLLSVSPWLVVKSTSHRMRYNTTSVWGGSAGSVEMTLSGRGNGDHFTVIEGTTGSCHLPYVPSRDPGIQDLPVPPLPPHLPHALHPTLPSSAAFLAVPPWPGKSCAA